MIRLLLIVAGALGLSLWALVGLAYAFGVFRLSAEDPGGEDE